MLDHVAVFHNRRCFSACAAHASGYSSEDSPNRAVEERDSTCAVETIVKVGQIWKRHNVMGLVCVSVAAGGKLVALLLDAGGFLLLAKSWFVLVVERHFFGAQRAFYVRDK